MTPGFHGRHWIAFALGVLLLALASRRRSPLLRATATTIGTGLITRSASPETT